VNALIANYTKKDLQEAVLVKYYRGQLPIHLACIYNAPLEVIQMLLENDSGKNTIHERCFYWGSLPIHLACSAGAPVEVIQLLLDSDDDKKTILEKNGIGQLPIHIACWKNAPVQVVQLLLASDMEKKTILEKDNNGRRLPIHIACEVNAPVEVIQLLLQASICDRIEQLDLEQWRIGVGDLINAIKADDSKTKKVQEIYERLSKYEEMQHTISLLALAIWRTSCLKWGSIEFQSMHDMEDFRTTDDAFDPVKFKRERRIKSGADVIIRGVLPFLPVNDETPTSTI
jgi:hypothetical protein